MGFVLMILGLSVTQYEIELPPVFLLRCATSDSQSLYNFCYDAKQMKLKQKSFDIDWQRIVENNYLLHKFMSKYELDEEAGRTMLENLREELKDHSLNTADQRIGIALDTIDNRLQPVLGETIYTATEKIDAWTNHFVETNHGFFEALPKRCDAISLDCDSFEKILSNTDTGAAALHDAHMKLAAV